MLEEYRFLSELEQSTTQMRHTTFTALISISFLLTGLAFRGDADSSVRVEWPIEAEIGTGKIAALFGFIFYCFTVIHYAWYHRYSHRYRDRLKQLEVDLGFEIYRTRKRPTIGRMKFHFDWTLYIIGLIYLAVVGTYVGWVLVSGVVASCAVCYGIFLLWSIMWDEEPLESKSADQVD